MFDLQTSLQDRLEELVTAGTCTDLDLLHITTALPEKIAQKLVLEVTNVCMTDEETTTLSLPDDTSTSLDRRMKWIELEEEAELNNKKAARNDDAEVQIQQWDLHLMNNPNLSYHWEAMGLAHLNNKRSVIVCKQDTLTQDHVVLFSKLRQLSLLRFQRNVYLSFLHYLKKTYGPEYLHLCLSCKAKGHSHRLEQWKSILGRERSARLSQDICLGQEALYRAANSSYWDWVEGSSLFFWRWPSSIREEARDGVPILVIGKLPRYKTSQRWPKDAEQRKAMEAKWLKVINRGYVRTGGVISLTGSFAVPKGADDIRMVYDASKCGLNESLWSPNFWLPTIDTSLRHATKNSWFGDIDLSKQFLNFALDPKIRPYAGIDVTALRDQLPLGTLSDSQMRSKGRIFLRWTRTLMGLKSSPYNANKLMAWLCDIVRGNPADP